MLIGITGTPGTGKSTVAKILSKHLNVKILDLEEIARKHKIIIEYDPNTRSMVIDEFKISDAIEAEIKKGENYVVPSHLAQFILPNVMDFLFVLRADPVVLEKRLGKRKYNAAKVADNVMCEFLDACLIEAVEMKHKKHLHEIDTSAKKPEMVAEEISDVVNKKKKPSFGNIKWLD